MPQENDSILDHMSQPRQPQLAYNGLARVHTICLVPKLCLGTGSGNSVSLLHAKQSFAEVRSQTEFGNEMNEMKGAVDCPRFFSPP